MRIPIKIKPRSTDASVKIILSGGMSRKLEVTTIDGIYFRFVVRIINWIRNFMPGKKI
jgi:hypothetical protein